MKSSETCAIEAVSVGAVLAADVLDENGRILMPAGAILTESAINGLRRREVLSVDIEAAATLNPAQREAQRVRLETRLARLFRHAGEQAESRALHHAMLSYRLKDLS